MLVHPVVCLAGEGAQQPVQRSTSATCVVGIDNLVTLVASAPTRLLSGDVEALARHLADHRAGAISTASSASAAKIRSAVTSASPITPALSPRSDVRIVNRRVASGSARR